MNFVRRLATIALTAALASAVLITPAHATDVPVMSCDDTVQEWRGRAVSAENELDRLYKVEKELRSAASLIELLDAESTHYRAAHQKQAATNDRLRARNDRLRQKIRELRQR